MQSQTHPSGERVVVGVDIGTTKICAVVASADETGRIHVRGVGVAASDGLNRGVVVNIDKTVDAVRKAIDEAERAAGIETRSVVVGIAGDHIQSFQSRAPVQTLSTRTYHPTVENNQSVEEKV